MTRVNVGIHPQELPRSLLLAEHREITRIPNAISAGRARFDLPCPDSFVLGKGSVRFFYRKMRYLHRRYLFILRECQRRGYRVTDRSACFLYMRGEIYKDYRVTVRDRLVSLNRIIVEKGFSLLPIDNFHLEV